ncbi:MAG: DUF1343 domain-containing protein, partial [Vicinamibacterales bacterium]
RNKKRMNATAPVSLGIDRLIASGQLSGRRVGLVCNPASVDATFRHSADRLWDEPRITLAALFGPQHGFRSDAQDNMIETPHAQHPRYRVPIYSLYGDSREPSADMLNDIDVLVIDLPDVGTRVYTYAYTMANCLRAAKRHGASVVICDRPNPIGGELVEGPMLEPGYESFVGQFPIPLRHGMTIGELARLFNDDFGIGAELEVAPLDGWVRSACQDETGLPWVMPSPNLPTLDAALVYPGAVLVEGTNLSEGRGTTRPFELIGAPWVDGEALAAHLATLKLPGVFFRPACFEPTFQKHARQSCAGCQVHVTDRRGFEPVLTTVALLQAIRRAAPDQFAWRAPPYEYEQVKKPIDILSGSNRLREQIDADVPAAEIAAGWRQRVAAFAGTRRRFLMY